MILADIAIDAITAALTGGSGGGMIIAYLFITQYLFKRKGGAGDSSPNLTKLEQEIRDDEQTKAWQTATTKSLVSIEEFGQKSHTVLTKIETGIGRLVDQSERKKKHE